MDSTQIVYLVFIIIIGIGLVGLIIYFFVDATKSKKIRKQWAKDNEIIKNEHDVLINDMKSKYGDITKEINFSSIAGKYIPGRCGQNYIFIFEKNKTIVIYGIPYNFKDITDINYLIIMI